MERLDETLAAFVGRIGEVKIFPPVPAAFWGESRPAKRFIIQGRKAIKHRL